MSRVCVPGWQLSNKKLSAQLNGKSYEQKWGAEFGVCRILAALCTAAVLLGFSSKQADGVLSNSLLLLRCRLPIPY